MTNTNSSARFGPSSDTARDAGSSGGGQRWIGLVVVALSQLTIMLDMTIMTVAMPSIQHGVDLSDGQRQWVLTAYTLTFGGLLLFGGSLADRFGRKRTFVIGLIGFTAASALGGAAHSGTTMIAARALQGSCAAILSPSTLSLLITMFRDPKERTRAIGVSTAVTLSGSVLGLPVGGLLTTCLSWRWCLYINLPIAVVALIGALAVLPALPGDRTAPVDLPGAVLGCGGTIALVYGLSEAADTGWRSTLVITAIASGLLLLSVFTLVERRVAHPLLPLSLLAERNRVGAFTATALSRLGLFGVLLFLTYQAQTVMHYSALRTGLAAIPLVLANAAAATGVVSRLTPVLPPRWLISSGLLFAGLAILLFTRLTTETSYVYGILPSLVLLGLGLGLTNSPAVSTALRDIEPRDAGVASAMVSVSRQLGASIGTPLLNTMATSAAAAYLAAHPDARTSAVVHGYVVACGWGGALLVAASFGTALLINAPLHRTAPRSRTSPGPSTA
jgi:EmrB/QacA subfamily drug resistance transporter